MGRETLTGFRLFIFDIFDHGHSAVSVFIVLSGYVLMLPIVRSETGQLRGGLGGFLIRRARRILPPYYGALFLFSGLILLARFRHIPNDFDKELSTASFLSHLFLAHNFKPEWNWMIDAPMWSLATEWQIYLVFGLILLPLYRWIGILPTIALTLVVSVLPHYVLPASNNFDQARYWYIGLFSFGMGAARYHFKSEKTTAPHSLSSVWTILSAITLLLYLVVWYVPALSKTPLLSDEWFRDILCGVMTTLLLLSCTNSIKAGKPLPLVRFLESRPLQLLGTFSYSLYLFHQPFMDYMIQLLRHFHLGNGTTRMAIYLFLPILVGICYLCYLLCERPFAIKQVFTTKKI